MNSIFHKIKNRIGSTKRLHKKSSNENLNLQEILFSQVKKISYICQNFENIKDTNLFVNEKRYFFDNIYGMFTEIENLNHLHREGTKGNNTKTTHRARIIVFTLLKALNLKPVLTANQPNLNISGIGMSDSPMYSKILYEYFNYTNTFFHKKPFLNIIDRETCSYSNLDFIISSDVFEHVPPPCEVAFKNCYDILKEGGVLIFTVPYNMEGCTEEYFPDLYDFKIEKDENEKDILINVTKNGEKVIYRDLSFHGGPGSTLAMRYFSLPDLERIIRDVGFKKYEIVDQDIPLFGILNRYEPTSYPIIAYK